MEMLEFDHRSGVFTNGPARIAGPGLALRELPGLLDVAGPWHPALAAPRRAAWRADVAWTLGGHPVPTIVLEFEAEQLRTVRVAFSAAPATASKPAGPTHATTESAEPIDDLVLNTEYGRIKFGYDPDARQVTMTVDYRHRRGGIGDRPRALH